MKRPLSLVLALSLLTTPALAASDLKSTLPDWAAGAYEQLEEARALPYGVYGYGVSAEGVIARGDFVQMLVASLQAVVPEEALAAVPPAAADYFADTNVPPDYILRADAYGIAQGRVGEDGLRYGDFRNGLSRQEAAKMVCSALDFFTGLGYEVDAAGEEAVYADAASIADWAAPYTGRVAAYQLMVGDEKGNFDPQGQLSWASALVLAERTLSLLEDSVLAAAGALPLESGLDWSGADAFGAGDYQMSKPLTGYAIGYYTIANADGTVTGVVVPPTQSDYNWDTEEWSYTGPTQFFVETYDTQGQVTASKTLPMELPTFGALLAGETYNYVAFGQDNPGKTDSREVWRIVQYDKDWNRVAAVSATGGETFTQEPFRSTVARMAESPDGRSVALYAARTRYDGHQSNITFLMDASPFSIKTLMGQEFPSNHVSHSFGQFIQYDGGKAVTVDHGDAYPRSFVLQDINGSKQLDLLKIHGSIGDNVTNAIGSGFEVSGDGYLFLGCSDPQQGGGKQPRNVFLAYADKGMSRARLTWLTEYPLNVDTARLVKLDENTFVAMWGWEADTYYQLLDGSGGPIGTEQVLTGVPMPPTQPAVRDGEILWIQNLLGKPCLFTLTPEA